MQYAIPETASARLRESAERRDRILLEIVTSEKTYLSGLVVCLQLFKGPLLKGVAAGELGVGQGVVEGWFGVMELLLKVNEALFKELIGKLNDWNDTQLVGDVIYHLAPYLKVYRQYTESYEDVINSLTECQLKDENLGPFVDELSKHSDAMNLSLPSLLILPVQRIPRYVLLLQDFLHHTSPSHPDYANLQKSLDLMKEVANYINQAIALSESRKKAISAIQSLGNPIDNPPHRRLLFEGWLKKENKRGIAKRKKFYLFTDILLYAKEYSVAANLKYCKHIELTKMNLDVVRVDSQEQEEFVSSVQQTNKPLRIHGFTIQAPKKSFFVYAETIEEKHQWVEELQKAMGRRDEDLKSAATWVPDHVMKACPLCYAEFGFFNRRHHCRKCGTLACSACSAYKMRVPEVDDKNDVRVCKGCLAETKK
uniref:Uncharacterized protein n=1 Tax=Arcella intermedia TaxID=1963864 RepID=A0A6B2L4J8_9EUKA